MFDNDSYLKDFIDTRGDEANRIMASLNISEGEYRDKLSLVREGLEDIDRVFSEDGILSDMIDGYQPRQSQIDAAKRVFISLAFEDDVIMEGPCGFGKTFAYLVPKMIHGVLFQDSSRVIIATDGISLQEQLYYKDLVTLNDISKELYQGGITYALLKGRQNYICEKKLHELQIGNPRHGASIERVLKSIKRGECKNMEFSDLPYTVDYDVVKAFSATEPGECKGGKCPFASKCKYLEAKNKAVASRYVATNYHLLFSDLLTGYSILGVYKTLIMDEGHKVPEIYREFNKSTLSKGSIQWMCNQVTALGNKDKGIEELYLQGLDTGDTLLKADIFFNEVENTIFYASRENIKLIDDRMDIILNESIMRDFLVTLGNYQYALNNIVNNLEEESEELISRYNNYYLLMESNDADSYDEIQQFIIAASSILDSLNDMVSLLTDYKELAAKDNTVVWAERNDRGLSINVMPTSVADQMYNHFISRMSSTIVTSATLSIGGKLDYVEEQMGMGRSEVRKTEKIIGKSPFKLDEQERWYIPKGLESAVGSNTQAFRESMIPTLMDIIEASNGGALCLFTSYSNMNYAFENLAGRMPRGVNLYKQGDAPRTQLLELFDSDENSVLLATRSFFTGVDIPGNSLRVVVVDKLPFPTPNDPVMMKMEEKYEGKTFQKVFMPEMIIDLKQAIGRGVRGVNDKCVVSVLDARIVESNYSRFVLTSFPYPKVGVHTKEEIKEFLQQ